jgi:ferric enterobactin receptor
MLETGAKAILRQVNSNYSLDTLLQARQVDFAHNPRRSNMFDYQQNVLAIYSIYNLAVGKKNALSLGTCIEQTAILGEFSGVQSGFSNSYFNVLPSVSATRTLKEPGHTLRLSFWRRIQRPNIYYLNPYVNQSSLNNVYYGNPTLSPELTNSYELAYSTFGKKTSLNASACVRYTGNSIERYNLYNDVLARTESTYSNLATNATYGVSLYGSLKPTNTVNVSSNLTLTYNHLASVALDRTTSQLSLNMSLNSSWKISKLYTLQGFGGFDTAGVQLQSRYSGHGYYSLALKPMLLQDKADLTLNASDFLQPGREFRSVTTTDQFTSTSISYQYQLAVRLSFNYRFGKLNSNGGRQRRAICNDDSKDGGSSTGS